MKFFLTTICFVFLLLQGLHAKPNEFVLKTLRTELTNYREEASKHLKIESKQIVTLFEKGQFSTLENNEKAEIIAQLKTLSVANSLYKDFLITTTQSTDSHSFSKNYDINNLNGWIWLKFAVLFELQKRIQISDHCFQQSYNTLSAMGRRFDGPTPLIQSPVLFVIKAIRQHNENINPTRLIQLIQWAEKFGINTESIGILQSLAGRKIQSSHPNESKIYLDKGIKQQYNHIIGFIGRAEITLIDICIILSFSMFCLYILFNSFLRFKYNEIRHKTINSSTDSHLKKALKIWFLPSQFFANKKELVTLFSIAFIYTVTISITLTSVANIGVQASLPLSITQEDYNDPELIQVFSTMKAKNINNKAVDYFLGYTYMALSQLDAAKKIFLDLSTTKQFKHSGELQVNLNYILNQQNSKSDRLLVNLDEANAKVFKRIKSFHKKAILPPSPEMYALLLNKHPIFSSNWLTQIAYSWAQLLSARGDITQHFSWIVSLILFIMLFSPLVLSLRVQNLIECSCGTPILNGEENCKPCEENKSWNDDEFLKKPKLTSRDLFRFKPLALLVPGLSLLTRPKQQTLGILLISLFVVTGAGSLMIYSSLPYAIGVLGKVGTPSFGPLDYLQYNVQFEPLAQGWMHFCFFGAILAYIVNFVYVIKNRLD